MRVEVIGDDAISHQARTYAEYRVFAALTQSTDTEKVRRVRVQLRPLVSARGSGGNRLHSDGRVGWSRFSSDSNNGPHAYAAINRAVERIRAGAAAGTADRVAAGRPAVAHEERHRVGDGGRRTGERPDLDRARHGSAGDRGRDLRIAPLTERGDVFTVVEAGGIGVLRQERPEGGGGDYGPNSGGFDQLGYGTLTATLDKAGPTSKNGGSLFGTSSLPEPEVTPVDEPSDPQ